MRNALVLIFLILVLGGCSGEPPATLPAAFEEGNFVNNGEMHTISLKLKQDGEKLSGRYAWDWVSVMRKPIFGDFTGTIEGNTVNLKLKLPAAEAKKRKMEEMEMILTYEPATPADAAATKDLVQKLAPLYEGSEELLPKDLDTRKIMKLQGSLNYKLNGTEDRMAIGFIPDISMGIFREDTGSGD